MKTSLMPIAIAAAVVGSSSLSARDDPVELKLTDLEARMIRIEKIVNNQSLIELANQLDQLRSTLSNAGINLSQLSVGQDGQSSAQNSLLQDQQQQRSASWMVRNPLASEGDSDASQSSTAVSANRYSLIDYRV